MELWSNLRTTGCRVEEKSDLISDMIYILDCWLGKMAKHVTILAKFIVLPPLGSVSHLQILQPIQTKNELDEYSKQNTLDADHTGVRTPPGLNLSWVNTRQ